MDFAPILHVLALVGVYILNLLIYETIVVVVWMGFTFAVFNSSIPESKSEVIMGRMTLIAFWAFIAICILLLFGIGCIVPYPA